MRRLKSAARLPLVDARGGTLPRRSFLLGALSLTLGCGSKEEVRRLPPTSVGMTSMLPPIYEDGELELYEVKRPLAFPVLRWSQEQAQTLRMARVDPYPRYPFIEVGDVGVQVTWTLSNLDDRPHNVRVLFDPWNEFGRYYPGFAVVDAEQGELLPMLSGHDELLELPGPGDALGRSTRLTGTITYEDMVELATDLATVMNIIELVPPPEPGTDENPQVTLANHAFSLENRAYNSPLVAPYIPSVIPGLTGIDFGIRTFEPANLALEVVVEVVDRGRERVIPEDRSGELREVGEPTETITVGTTA